ncbi:hypothetical protein [Acinetobacter ursingii]|uniref:hypothetical protein n=1 Tax=Acinetobacter ursingii TaxID=108980 RepID=UPI0021CDC200|nr:hypothetical protein [Acinetobacter ursingii]MCU4483565.1 hypothetical protein [Acinetobacter ursingii]MCU4507885.1 hypothetical protein [Acinetobacter ursingii]
MVDLKATSFKDGERPACPYCKSIQVKAMSVQPKKYPYPEHNFLTSRKEIEALREVWHKGYDCKKCGKEFIAIPWTITPLWEDSEKANHINAALSSTSTKTKSGFFTKLLGWMLLAVIAFFVYMIIFHKADHSKKSDTEPTQAIENAKPTQENDPLKQEFSKEAEEAAHAYIPPIEEKPHKSISDSQDQNDTLSIKTTIRGSN